MIKYLYQKQLQNDNNQLKAHQKSKNIAGRLPQYLRKNRLACRIIEIETYRYKLEKLSTPLKQLCKKIQR